MSKIERQIHKFDASGQALGRLATQIAHILHGKHKADYAPHIDAGDIVEVINIDKLSFRGKKLEQKNYYHFSGYIGGLKTEALAKLFIKDPAEVLRRAVKQMLAPTKLRKAQLKRLIIR